MQVKTLENLIWALIYGGLIVLCVGLFLPDHRAGLGWTFVVGGGAAAAAGAVLIWVRSRMAP